MSLFLVAAGDVTLGGGVDLVPPVWRTIGSLALVLALLAGLAWVLRRTRTVRQARGALTIEAGLALGERRSLAIVTVDGRRLLLGLAPNHVSLVTELSRPATFDGAMQQAIGMDAQAPSTEGMARR